MRIEYFSGDFKEEQVIMVCMPINFQVYRGPNQVRTPKQIKPGHVFIEHHTHLKDDGSPFGQVFSIALAEPYVNEDGYLEAKTRQIRVGGKSPFDFVHTFYLSDQAVTQYKYGRWNATNWLETFGTIPEIASSEVVPLEVKRVAFEVAINHAETHRAQDDYSVHNLINAAMLSQVHDLNLLFDRIVMERLVERMSASSGK